MPSRSENAALPPPKYLPAQFEAMCDADIPPILRLAEGRALELGIRYYCGALARAAHADGASWAEIGKALGVTRQAAWARYGS